MKLTHKAHEDDEWKEDLNLKTKKVSLFNPKQVRLIYLVNLPENDRSHILPCAWIISATESIGFSFFNIVWVRKKKLNLSANTICV